MEHKNGPMAQMAWPAGERTTPVSWIFWGPPCTWRTIPVSKWLITMVSKSPNWGYGTPYKWPKLMACK